MCLKPNLKVQNKDLEQEIIKQAEQLIDILENGRQKEKLLKYEVVRQQGYYNMFDPRARKMTGLTEEDYIYIQKHYTELMQRFPDTKVRAKRNLEYLKSANISKIIALKGCENCIQTVSKKLDVTENDLCESCRKIIELYSSP